MHDAALNPMLTAGEYLVNSSTWTAVTRPAVRGLALQVVTATENRPCAEAAANFQGHWMHMQLQATGTFGRCGRGAQAALTQQQYLDDSNELTPALQSNLVYHMLLPKLVGPRSVNVVQRNRPLLRVYSDASYEAMQAEPAKLGAVVFSPSLSKPRAFAAVMPESEMKCLLDRKQQITPREALPVLYLPYGEPELFRGTDVIWFIDNQAAMNILIKGSSSQADLADIAAAAHLTLAKLGCRVFFEWIESSANPSDGLSREGLSDQWTRIRTGTSAGGSYQPC